ILIIAEFFVVGGFLGVLGGLAVLGSLFMAGYDLTQMSISVGIAFVVAIIAAVFLFRSIGKNKVLVNKLVLQDRKTTGEGYISANDRDELIGLTGVKLKRVRTSGNATVDNELLDVVYQIGYIDKDKNIEIIFVQGTKIVVRENDKTN